MESKVLVSSSWQPMIGHMGAAQSSTKGDSDITNFSVRLVKHWNSLPREAVDAPHLSLFKRHLNNALNNML